MAVKDFIHDEAIMSAVLERLGGDSGTLPSAWRSGEDPYLRLKTLEFGDLKWFTIPVGRQYADLCPAILIRSLKTKADQQDSGLGGKQATKSRLRLVHIRHYDALNPTRNQCRDSSNTGTLLSPPRTQAHYAKAICQALFADRKLGNPSLNTSDTSARILESTFQQVDYTETEDVRLAHQQTGLVALAIDFTIRTRTQ